MLRLFTTLVFIALFGCSTLTAPSQSNQSGPVFVSPVDKAVASTVVLLAKEKPYTWNGLVCAGVWVGPHRVLTAYHCIVPAAFDELDQKAADMGIARPLNPVAQEVHFVNHDSWVPNERDDGKISAKLQTRGYVLAADESADIALIETTASAPMYVELSPRKVVVGESVFTVGHPAGLSYSFSRGYVSNPTRTLSEKERLYTQVNISVWHGNSGGGLFDETGRLVGICSAMFSQNPSISFFVALDPIQKMVRRN